MHEVSAAARGGGCSAGRAREGRAAVRGRSGTKRAVVLEHGAARARAPSRRSPSHARARRTHTLSRAPARRARRCLPPRHFWRLAGMTYLQYVNTASATVRGVLKESVKTKALARDTVFFHHISQSGVKTPVNSLAEVSAMK